MIEQYTNRIAAVLAESRLTVRKQDRLSWELQPTAHDCAFSLRACEDWLLLEAALDASAYAAATAEVFLPELLLGWNATLPGGAKFGVDGKFNLTVRAEVPLIEEFDCGPRATEALNCVLAGLARFNGPPLPRREEREEREETTLALSALAAETGWAFTERDDGRVSFDLPSPAGVLAATLQPHGCGARVWVPLAEVAGLSTASRHALAVLFLRAGSVLRLARPAFVADGDETSACFEVVFATAPTAAELTQALESLAVGVSMAAAEAKLLCEEQTAREFLCAANWIPRQETNNNTNQRTP